MKTTEKVVRSLPCHGGADRARWEAVGAAALVAGACAVVQLLSAAFIVKGFHSPNFASRIAGNLAERGVYAGGEWWRLQGPSAPAGQPELRAFHLPGEPLFLAAAFRTLPTALHRFLHVPVTTLLVGAAAFAGALVLGPKIGLLAGLFASMQPFIVQHGPVWDDTFLGAALEWLVVALLLAGVARRRDFGSLFLFAFLAGWAALVRSQSQAVLGALAAAIVVVPTLRGHWRGAVALGVGIAVALGGWGLRNRLVLGTFLLGSTHDGITLWESNYPSAVEALLERGQVERLNSERMSEDFARTISLGEVDADRYFRARAMERLRSQPLEIAKAAAVKLWITAIGIRPEEPLASPRNLVAAVGNLLLAALTIAGLCTLAATRRPATLDGERRAQRTLLLAYCTLTTAATVALTCIGPVGMRYRIGLDACCWLACGVALARGLAVFAPHCAAIYRLTSTRSSAVTSTPKGSIS